MIWAANRAVGGLFDLLLWPFRGLPPIVGLTVISLVVSVLILWGFKATSDQEALAEVKRRIHAGVFEIRLFKDDFRAILSAQLGILRHTFRYFRLSIVPMIWMLVPIVIVVVQLQFQYGYRALEPGETTLVTVRFTSEGAREVETNDGAELSLAAPAGLRVETDQLWIPSLGEADWRIAAETPGEYQLELRVGDAWVTKSVRVSGGVRVRSPVRPRSWLEQLVYPAEAPLPPGSSVARIEVAYADAEVSLLGWEMHWIVAFFILTMVFAFLLQRPMGVKL